MVRDSESKRPKRKRPSPQRSAEYHRKNAQTAARTRGSNDVSTARAESIMTALKAHRANQILLVPRRNDYLTPGLTDLNLEYSDGLFDAYAVTCDWSALPTGQIPDFERTCTFRNASMNWPFEVTSTPDTTMLLLTSPPILPNPSKKTKGTSTAPFDDSGADPHVRQWSWEKSEHFPQGLCHTGGAKDSVRVKGSNKRSDLVQKGIKNCGEWLKSAMCGRESILLRLAPPDTGYISTDAQTFFQILRAGSGMETESGADAIHLFDSRNPPEIVSDRTPRRGQKSRNEAEGSKTAAEAQGFGGMSGEGTTSEPNGESIDLYDEAAFDMRDYYPEGSGDYAYDTNLDPVAEDDFSFEDFPEHGVTEGH